MKKKRNLIQNYFDLLSKYLKLNQKFLCYLFHNKNYFDFYFVLRVQLSLARPWPFKKNDSPVQPQYVGDQIKKTIISFFSILCKLWAQPRSDL